MKKTLVLLLAVAMICAIALSACTPSGGGTTTAPSGGGTTTAPSGGDTTTAPSGGNKRTDVNIPLDSIGNSMDPHASTLRVDGLVLRQQYEPLYFFKDDGSYDERLAVSHSVSDDGLEYTFKLREGVVFQDGSPFTASDVIYSIQRCLDNAWNLTYVGLVTGMSAPDDHTVVFKIDSPSSLFLRNICSPSIVSEKVVAAAGDKYGTDAFPAGTGPYKMTKYDVNAEILLEYFPEHWSGVKPPITNIRFVPMNDASTQLIAFENGEFDFCQIPAADWANVEGSGKYTTVTAPGIHISYMGINVGKADSPLQNEKVRQAIAYACDKESMIAIGADGLADPADHLMRVGFIDGAQETDFNYSYDPEKAKALLVEAGYPEGFHLSRVEAITAANGRYLRIAQVLQQNLADIGITCDIVQGETASMLPAWKTDRTYDIFVSGFTPSFSYYELTGYIHSKENVQVQLNLNPDIDTDLIDSCLDNGLIAKSADEANKYYKECEEYLLQVAGYIPIMHVNSLYAWNKDLNATVPIRTFEIKDWSWK